MHKRPAQLHEAIAVLAPPRRFELLLLMLAGADRSVSQLAKAVGLSQSCTTRHLQALARAGLVKGTRDGKRVVFRLAPRDDAARAVIASVSGGPPREARPRLAAAPPAAARARARRPRRAAVNSSGRGILASAIRIESAAELEPLMATDANADRAPWVGSPSVPESGRTSQTSDPLEASAPDELPAWRRSDLEDFLL